MNKINIAQDLFLLAEECNREDLTQYATDLKMIYRELIKELNEEETQEVEDFLQSVGA